MIATLITATVIPPAAATPPGATTPLDTTGLYRIVATRNGRVIYAHSFNGHPDTALCNNQSLTKSVVSLLIGIAIGKKYIPSIDEPITTYFPELNNDSDPRKRRIKIRDIMNQASGLWHENLETPNGIPDYLKLDDQTKYVLDQPMLSDPGAVFHYNNAATHLLSAILTKATRQSTLAFAQAYLFGPLHIKNVQWDKMKDGYYDGCGLLSLHLTTDDMNRIGTLLLTQGEFEHRQVVPKAWIDQIVHPTQTYPTPWGFQGSRYALCYYHYTYENDSLTYGLGWGGQFLVTDPPKGLVVTVNQDPNSPRALQQSIDFTQHGWEELYKKLIFKSKKALE